MAYLNDLMRLATLWFILFGLVATMPALNYGDDATAVGPPSSDWIGVFPDDHADISLYGAGSEASSL